MNGQHQHAYDGVEMTMPSSEERAQRVPVTAAALAKGAANHENCGNERIDAITALALCAADSALGG